MLRLASRATLSGAAAVMGAIALGGCVLLGSNRHDDAQRELNQNRRLWEAQGIDDYRFVARRSCFCGPESTAPVVVEVRDDQIVSLTYQETGEPVSETYAGLWPSLDGVFDIVQDAIDRDSYQVIVEYDRERGFPTVISIDYIEQAIDDELVFYSGPFELLP
jgi:hypothetical protein